MSIKNERDCSDLDRGNLAEQVVDKVTGYASGFCKIDPRRPKIWFPRDIIPCTRYGGKGCDRRKPETKGKV